MAGLVPAIHVFVDRARFKDVDARHKAGHDGEGHGSPGLNGSSLPGGTLASETASTIAIVT